MDTISELAKRRKVLMRVKSSLDRKASLQTKAGRAYLSCLALLVMTKMQIAEKEKTAHNGAAK